MAGTALDLSGINVSQAVEKMNNQILSAEKFDLDMKEKRMVEFMSDIETAELNDALVQRNTLSIADKIQGFKDEWSGVMAEKNGRLTTQDRIKMKQAQGKINREVQRLNGIQKEFERGQQEIKFGRDADKYDREEFERRGQEWINNGTPPPDGTFLDIAPVDPSLYYSSAKYPQKSVDTTTVRRYNQAGRSLDTNTEVVWATDDMRKAQANHDFMTNEQVRRGVIKMFTELPEDEQRTRIEQAKENGTNPYVTLNEELALENLWKNTKVDQSMQTAQTYAGTYGRTGGGSTRQPINPVYMDSHRIGVKDYPNGGYDLSGINFRADRILIGDAVNLQTGESETFDGAIKATDALFYNEKENKLVLVIEKKNYKKQRTDSTTGEPLFRVVDPGGSPIKTRMSKQEAEQLAKQRGGSFRAVPDTETLNTAFVEYEIDTAKYPATLEAIKRSGVVLGSQPKSQPKASISADQLKALPLSERANYKRNADGTFTKK